jgi:hypothetical protein
LKRFKEKKDRKKKRTKQPGYLHIDAITRDSALSIELATSFVSQGFLLLQGFTSLRLRFGLFGKRLNQLVASEEQDVRTLLGLIPLSSLSGPLLDQVRALRLTSRSSLEEKDFLIPSTMAPRSLERKHASTKEADTDPFAYARNQKFVAHLKQIGEPSFLLQPEDEDTTTVLEQLNNFQAKVRHPAFDVSKSNFPSIEFDLSNVAFTTSSTSSSSSSSNSPNKTQISSNTNSRPSVNQLITNSFSVSIQNHSTSELQTEIVDTIDEKQKEALLVTLKNSLLKGPSKQDLKKADLNKVYGQNEVDRQRGDVNIRDPLLLDPEVKHDKWTYQLLAESVPMTKMIQTVLNSFRAGFRKIYETTTEQHIFEFLFLVDNSGSMVRIENEVYETLVFLMETLRRLECRFAIGRFGNASSQECLKLFETEFSLTLGQRVLESFSFDEATYPADGFAVLSKKVWKEKKVPKNTHRIVLMITDGLAQQSNPDSYADIIEDYSISLNILNLKDTTLNQAALRLLKNLKESKGIYVEDIPIGGLTSGALPSEVYKILARQFAKTASASQSSSQPTSSYVCRPPPAELGKFLYPVHLLEPISLAEGQTQGMARLNAMYQASPPRQDVPFAKLVKKLEESKEVDSLKLALQALAKLYADLPKTSGAHDLLATADSQWKKAESKFATQITDLVNVFEDYMFPFNKFTRRKADLKGSSIYLPGLIKAVITDWTYKKYLSSQSGGGKRVYGVNVALVLDVSLSMSGHLAQSAIETIVTFIGALTRIGIEDFSIILFGQEVRVLKSFAEEWGPTAMYLLLASLRFEQFGTLDANAINCAVDILEASGTRGPKKIFVISDGYGTTGLRLVSFFFCFSFSSLFLHIL